MIMKAKAGRGGGGGGRGEPYLRSGCAQLLWHGEEQGGPMMRGTMNPQHRMILDSRSGEELLFVCPHEGCGRRLVLKRSGELVVLQTGDFFALHSGGTEGLGVSARFGG
jgi:hypothetical protein